MANNPSGFTPLESVNLRAMGSLGEALGESLQNIAINKAKQYQQNDLVGKLMAGYKIPREQAEIIASGGPKAQAAFLQQYMKDQRAERESAGYNQEFNRITGVGGAPTETEQPKAGGPLLNSKDAKDLRKFEYEIGQNDIKAIRKENEPYTKELQERVVSEGKVERAAREVLKLAKDPKVYFGVGAGTFPQSFSNKNTQRIDSLLKQIVIYAAQAGGGRTTDTLLKLTDAAKASRSMGREAFQERVQDILREAQLSQEEGRIAQQLGKKAKGGAVRGLQQEVLKYVEPLERLRAEAPRAPEGTIAEENGIEFEFKNGGWKVVL